MHGQLGIEFLWKNRRHAVRGAPTYGDITLEFDTGGRLCVDAVLVAAGRSSNTAALNLAAAGLEAGPRGLLTVDAPLPHHRPAHLRRRRRHRLPRPGLHQHGAGPRRHVPRLRHRGTRPTSPPSCPPGSTPSPRSAWSARPRRTSRPRGSTTSSAARRTRDCARGEIIGDQTGFLKLLFRRDGHEAPGRPRHRRAGHRGRARRRHRHARRGHRPSCSTAPASTSPPSATSTSWRPSRPSGMPSETRVSTPGKWWRDSCPPGRPPALAGPHGSSSPGGSGEHWGWMNWTDRSDAGMIRSVESC